MELIVFLVWVMIIYLGTGLVTYLYSVLSTFMITGFWTFKINDGFIGICKYPKYLLFWLDWIVARVRLR